MVSNTGALGLQGLQLALTAPAHALCGRRIVQVESSPAEGIDADDLLRIDFDTHEIGSDSYYVLERRDGAWNGVWRFSRSISGLQVQDGKHWRPVQQDELSAFNVLGRVDRVYKSSVF